MSTTNFPPRSEDRLPGLVDNHWQHRRIGELLTYERPDQYIVKSTEYLTSGDTPVLTANKTFILGYTDETSNIFQNVPAIVFDDFTTDCKYATFPFKVKSSAIKILRPKHDNVDLRYVFELMQTIRFPVGDHKRYYISEYQDLKIPVPPYREQKAIVAILDDIDTEIHVLELLREKKGAIRQAVVQQLLSRSVRLAKPVTRTGSEGAS